MALLCWFHFPQTHYWCIEKPDPTTLLNVSVLRVSWWGLQVLSCIEPYHLHSESTWYFLLLVFFLFIYLLCVFTHMCATTHVPCGGQWTIFRRHFLSCYVGPGDQIWVIRFLLTQPSCVFRLFLLRSFYEFYARPWGAFYHCSFKFSICHAFLQFPCILSYLERPCNLVFLHLHLFIPYRSGDSWPRSFLVISFLLKICLGVLVYYILLILIEHCNILWSLCRLTMVSSLNIEQAKGAGARTLPFQPGWSRRHLT